MENTRLRERIREAFARSRQTHGSPRLARALGCLGRRNRMARLMRRERPFARQRCKYRPARTDSRHGGPICAQPPARPRRPTAGSSLGHGCPLRAHRPGLVVRRRGHGCLQPAGGWLGHEPNPGCLTGHRRPPHGPRPTSPPSSTRIVEPSLPARLTGSCWPNTVCSLP